MAPKANEEAPRPNKREPEPKQHNRTFPHRTTPHHKPKTQKNKRRERADGAFSNMTHPPTPLSLSPPRSSLTRSSIRPSGTCEPRRGRRNIRDRRGPRSRRRQPVRGPLPAARCRPGGRWPRGRRAGRPSFFFQIVFDAENPAKNVSASGGAGFRLSRGCKGHVGRVGGRGY